MDGEMAQEEGAAAETTHTDTHFRAVMLSIVIILIVALVVIVVFNSISKGPITSTASSTITFLNTSKHAILPKLYSFLASYSPATKLNFYSISNSSILTPPFTAECFSPTILKQYISQKMSSPLSPISEAMANSSSPFVMYIKVQVLNSSTIQTYPSIFYANKGYCENYVGQIASNSTFTSIPVKIDNASGFLLEFTNLNSKALAISNTPYTGPMPNVSWYSINILYKNVSVGVGAWGFTGHMGGVISNLTSTASTIINYVKQLVG